MPTSAIHVRSSAILVGIAVLVLSPSSAPGWGCKGHETIALIAKDHLSTSAARHVMTLIGNPAAVIEPGLHRFCRPSAALAPIANVSTWADDVRAVRPETAGWHFVDIPRGTTPDGLTAFCPVSGCVTSEIAAQMKVLRNTHAGRQKRAEALMYLVHFVGDVHQPLHCTTNDDRGGNCVPVSFFGRQPVPNPHSGFGSTEPNLHAVWDNELIARDMDHRGVAAYAEVLERRFHGRFAGWLAGRVKPEDWAWESFRLAESDAYGKLPTPIPVETPQPVHTCADDNGIGARMGALHEAVDQAYQDAVAPVIEQRLAQAGARLALVLNTLWP
jgi:hypothetical protein